MHEGTTTRPGWLADQSRRLARLAFKLLLSCGQDANHFQADQAMSARLRPRTDGVGEILAFQAQWLDPVDVRNSDFAVAVRNNGIGVHISSLVIDLEHLG